MCLIGQTQMINFIKVTATTTIMKDGKAISTIARGVSPLGKREKAEDFIHKFMKSRELTELALYQRSATDWALALCQIGEALLAYTFHVFQTEDIRFQMRDLTETEYARDKTLIVKKYPEVAQWLE